MIALILGGSPSVWDDLATAEQLLAGRRHVVVAANLAGIHYDGKLDALVSLHPDLIGGWLKERSARKGNADPRVFAPCVVPGVGWADIVAERWPGSSGLYAVQIALLAMGATAAITCGVPMDSEAGHFCDPGPWAATGDYRQAFATALPLIGGRTRAMGGWTAELYGCPTAAWVDAVDNITPLGPARPDHRSRSMHKVTNASKGTQSFWVRGPDGMDRRAHLQPGESDTFEIDPNAPPFNGPDLTVEAIPEVPVDPEPAPARRKA